MAIKNTVVAGITKHNQVPLLYALYSKGYKQSVVPYAIYLRNNNIVDKYRVQCVPHSAYTF